MTDMTDEQLMEQLKKGETDSVDGLSRRYAKRLYVLYCTMFITGTPEDFVRDRLKICGEFSCLLMI